MRSLRLFIACSYFHAFLLSFAGLLLANGCNVPFIRFEFLSVRSFRAVHTLNRLGCFVRSLTFLCPCLSLCRSLCGGCTLPPPKRGPVEERLTLFTDLYFSEKIFFSYFCPYEQGRKVNLGFRRRAEEVQRRVGCSFRFHQGCLQGDGRAIQSDLRLRERRDEKGGWLRVAKGRGGGVGFPSFLILRL